MTDRHKKYTSNATKLRFGRLTLEQGVEMLRPKKRRVLFRAAS